jgi:two-component system, NtrC family, response regulator
LVKSTVLIVDDEVSLRKLLARVIALEGYTVLEAGSIKEALKILGHQETVQVVITDVMLPDGNGVEFTTKVKSLYPGLEVIVLTAYGTISDGVTAIKNGAFDYLTKGDHQDKIIPLLSKASEKAALQQRVVQLEGKLKENYGFDAMLGEHMLFKKSVELARKVAVTDTVVLLLGETGTGKEVFSRAIHYESHRNTKPFIALNCSAFPKDLLESELFGHAEGAFTGATRSKKGYLEEAHEGTLFLDEIGEMNIDLQAKLLRVLESGEFYRVGDSKPRKVNVRFLAATNRDLLQESASGHFRNDLFYRLSVFTINLPALRDRQSDIKILATYFITHFSHKTKRQEPAATPGFMQALEVHPWKGNIRELRNIIERCVILAGEELSTSLLPADFLLDTNPNSLELTAMEKSHIIHVLNIAGGNKTQAAKLLGIGISTLYTKIKEYNL